MRVTVLGTGTMGAAMARNLVRAGHDVVVWDRTRAKAEAVEGARVADTPADAVRDVDAAVTMLVDGRAVEEVVRPLDALSLWIQMSTVGIEATERLIELAKEKGATFVDAPVSGTKEPAEKGELLVLASGPEEARPQADEIFDAVGSRTIWLGEAGSGTRFKLVLNAWLVGLVEVLAETITLTRALGFEAQQFLDAIKGSPLESAYADAKTKLMVDGEFPPSFTARLADKDAKLILDAAQAAGLELPAVAAAAKELDRTVELGHGDDDVAAVVLALG
jgi:3-hydroxyisobutyrate dehydrogenase